MRSDQVTEHLKPILPHCDLIVGTEEELHIAGGSEDTLAAIRAIRAVSPATIVCKRGPMGCVVFPGEIPDSLEDGVKGPGFPVEVYNVLGAGDAFLSGFLRGWLRERASGDLLRLCQCERRLRGVAPPLLARDPDFRGTAALSAERQPASGAAPRPGPQPHPLGDDAAAGGRHADGLRHRPSRAVRGDGAGGRRRRRRRCRPSSASRSRRRRGWPTAVRASAC